MSPEHTEDISAPAEVPGAFCEAPDASGVRGRREALTVLSLLQVTMMRRSCSMLAYSCSMLFASTATKYSVRFLCTRKHHGAR